jgi:serine/threonine-protein kinase
MQTAIGLFQQALRQDPAYALAHSGLADAYSVLGSFGVVPPREVFPLAREAALKAIELDDSLAEAHSSLGVMKCLYEWDWPGAEKAFQRALRLNPASASAHHCFALTCLTPQSRLDEALTEIGRATELDPLAFNITAAMASILFCRGEYDRADAQNRKALHMAPNYPMTYVYQAQVYMAKGLVDKGLALLVRARDLFAGNTSVMAVLGYGYAAHGRAVEALQILADLETKSRQGYVPPSDLATIAVGLGDKDRCFEYLDEAAEARDGGLIFLAVDRKFEPLRRDARYAALLHRMGLAASGASVSRVVER